MLAKINTTKSTNSSYTRTGLASLPAEILCNIVTYLEIPDRVCLALTDKHFAQIVALKGLIVTKKHLQLYGTNPVHVDSIRAYWHSIIQRLGTTWLTANYRLCSQCAVARPSNAEYWMEKLKKGKANPARGRPRGWKWKVAEGKGVFRLWVHAWVHMDRGIGRCPRCCVASVPSWMNSPADANAKARYRIHQTALLTSCSQFLEVQRLLQGAFEKGPQQQRCSLELGISR